MWDVVVDNRVAAFIVGCEIGLWVLLGIGLTLRYLVRWRLLGGIVLAAIPLLDVALVIATAIDLRAGTPAGLVHGLAAVYLGFSVAFGPSIVRWADVRFAHRFAAGPAPVRPPKRGPERQKRLWREWYRVVLAATISSVVLAGLVVFVGSPAQDAELVWWISRVWGVAGLWLLFGPVWEQGRNAKGWDETRAQATDHAVGPR